MNPHPADGDASSNIIPCLAASSVDLSGVEIGRVNKDAGKAAFDFLCKAVDLTLAGEADAIVTAPLHKEGLAAAGLAYPGHTEILAKRTETSRLAMALHGDDLSVIHVTLHTALRDVFGQLTTDAVSEKIRLLDNWLPNLLGRRRG